MHTTPWYEFPFGSRLAALWREVPLRGPHMLRKIERRMALSTEYGGKAVYGWIIGKASGAAYGGRGPAHSRAGRGYDARLRSRITGSSWSSRSGRVHYIVTLPRYEAFTAAALALNAKGARFMDIAGNDELLITVLARRGMPTSVPGRGCSVASADPDRSDDASGSRFTCPRSWLREVIEHLARETCGRAPYDY